MNSEAYSYAWTNESLSHRLQAITTLQANHADELKAAETKLSTAMQRIEFLTKENEVLFSENSELDKILKESQHWSPSA